MYFPPVKFAVFADPHYFSPGLAPDGQARELALREMKDIKMIMDAGEILAAAVEAALKEQVDFVLVCGDITKDGERESHQEAAAILEKLPAAGIPVFVINGNHDIRNHHSRRYVGSRSYPAPSVSPDEFAHIYRTFGFAASFSRDPHSLSYAAEAAPGLWLLALDSCVYHRKARVGGRLSSSTAAWVSEIMGRAAKTGHGVIAMMHHGLLEHYPGNRRFYPQYIIERNRSSAASLAGMGLPVVFTGHFHAQDVQVFCNHQGGFIYDIETASLVTFPCAYRVVSVTCDQTLLVQSKAIVSTESHPMGFRQYAHQYCYAQGVAAAQRKLRRLGLRRADAAALAPQIIDAFQAHCVGNPHSTDRILDFAGINAWGRFVMSNYRALLTGLWEQSGPPDNDLVINLADGTWEKSLQPALDAEPSHGDMG